MSAPEKSQKPLFKAKIVRERQNHYSSKSSLADNLPLIFTGKEYFLYQEGETILIYKQDHY